MDTKRDGSTKWNVGMEGYRAFREDWKGRQGGGVVNDQLEFKEFPLQMNVELRVNGSGLKAVKGQVTL